MKYEVFLSSTTKNRLKSAISGDMHALIIESPLGSQYQQVNAYIEHILDIAHGVSIVIEPNGKSIGIDDVKSLRVHFSLKNIGNEKRLVFINSAQTITKEAQNALLKILEEPPAGTIFIINTSDFSALLPTVLSRALNITTTKPEKDTLEEYFRENNFKQKDIDQALAISGGWPELAQSILSNESSDFMEELTFAKKLLQSTLLQRLKEVEPLSKQKARIPLLLFALERLALAANSTYIQSKSSVNERWVTILKAVETAQERSKYNVNNRILLTDLMLQL